MGKHIYGLRGGSVVKNLPAMQKTQDQEDTLEEGLANHSSILAWRIPWTEEPGRLQFIGSHRVDTTEVTKQQQAYTYMCLFIPTHSPQCVKSILYIDYKLKALNMSITGQISQKLSLMMGIQCRN